MAVFALVLSVISLACVAWVLWRDAKIWRMAEQAVPADVLATVPRTPAQKLEAIIKRHQSERDPSFNTSVGYVRNLMAMAERESAKVKLIK